MSNASDRKEAVVIFATKEEILNNSRYKEELEKLDDVAFQALLDRVDNYITMRTHKDYSTTTNELIKRSLKTVTWRLMDYLFYFDQEEVSDSFSDLQSESIGDYSYTRKSDVGIGLTGDKELDALLDALTVKPFKPLFFEVFGSGKRGGRR